MKLYEQVCSLELAKRLKELGVKQESIFCFYGFENPFSNNFKESDLSSSEWLLGLSKDASKQGADWRVSAFTVAELGEMLPREVHHLTDGRAVHSELNMGQETDSKWFVHYPFLNSSYERTEADARALMLCYLIEQGLAKV